MTCLALWILLIYIYIYLDNMLKHEKHVQALPTDCDCSSTAEMHNAEVGYSVHLEHQSPAAKFWKWCRSTLERGSG